MEPIAVYECRDVTLRRRYELSTATIRATGKSERKEFDGTLKLAGIDPLPERIKVQDPRVYLGAIVLFLGVVVLFVVAGIAASRDDHSFPAWLLIPAGVLGAVGLGIALKHRRAIEYALFRSDAGVPILTIPRDRADAGEFDSFVALLIKKIQIAKGAAQAGPFREVPSESPR
jgi:hypothetical protein